MEKNLVILKNNIKEEFKKRFNIDADFENNIDIKDDYVLLRFFNSEKLLGIIIISNINNTNINDLNEYRNHIMFNEGDKVNNFTYYFFIVSLEIIPEKTLNELHKNNYSCFNISNVEEKYFISEILDYYFYLGQPIPTFQDIILEIEDKSLKEGEHYEHVVTSILNKYFLINNAKPIWSDEELSYATSEYKIFSATMKTEISERFSDINSYGKTFIPSMSFKTKDGKEIQTPDIENLGKDKGINKYIFDRYHSTRNHFFKRRYIELLIFWNSNLLNKPTCFLELIKTIQDEIECVKLNIDKFKYPDMHLTYIYHRFIEVVLKYNSTFNNDLKIQLYKYYYDYIENLKQRNEFRWILDMIENLFLYNIKPPFFFEENFNNLKNLIEDGWSYYIDAKNYILEMAYIDLLSKMKVLKDEYFDKDEALASSFERHANERAKKDEFLVATSLIEDAIKKLQNNKQKHKEKINKLKIIHKEWAKKSLKNLKAITTKIPFDKEEIIKQREPYLAYLSNMNTDDAIKIFFTDPQLLMPEEVFLNHLKIIQNSIASKLLTPVIVDERGTVLRPRTEEEKQELDEFRCYSLIAQFDIERLNYFFNTIIDRKIFTTENIKNFIQANYILRDDEKSYLIEAFSQYENKSYASSISLVAPMVERFFRGLLENTAEDVKHKVSGIEYNVSLDDMIKKSISAGFPTNIVRFGRYLFSRSDCLNVRNNVAHGLVAFNWLNNKYLNEIVLWFVANCYFGITESKEDKSW